MAGQAGCEHQGRHGGQVAEGGYQRRQDVVQVPAEADRPGGQGEGHHSDQDRGQQSSQGRHHDEVGQGHRRGDAEHDGRATGHHAEGRTHHHAQGGRPDQVLPDHAIGSGRESEGPCMHGGSQAAPHGPEHVAPQCNRTRNEEEEARQLGQRPLRCGQDHATGGRGQHPDGESDDPLAHVGRGDGRVGTLGGTHCTIVLDRRSVDRVIPGNVHCRWSARAVTGTGPARAQRKSRERAGGRTPRGARCSATTLTTPSEASTRPRTSSADDDAATSR